MTMRRALVLSAWLMPTWITPAIAQSTGEGAPADCSAILGPADCSALVDPPSPVRPTTGAPAALAPPAAPPYTATSTAPLYGQANQAELPSAYSNGLVPYDPTTGVLDPAFVSALGLDPKVPITVQRFQQYWSSPNPSNGNHGTS
jgi:hypothetical protein